MYNLSVQLNQIILTTKKYWQEAMALLWRHSPPLRPTCFQQRKSPKFWTTKWSKERTWLHSFERMNIYPIDLMENQNIFLKRISIQEHRNYIIFYLLSFTLIWTFSKIICWSNKLIKKSTWFFFRYFLLRTFKILRMIFFHDFFRFGS